MINKIWAFMIIIGGITSLLLGKGDQLTDGILIGARDAVSLSITMLGVVSIWSGVMRIGERAGLIEGIKNLLNPILRFLFPSVPKNSKAMAYIATNLTANVLGLGWAATPSGLLAMEELKRLNKNKNEASNSMCMFMIINMSSIQLISVNLIAYRMEYGSKNPSEITLPIILTTLLSTLFGIIYAKLMEGKK